MKVIVDGLPVDYWDEGKGKVLLFLHGWGSSKEAFQALIDALKGGFRCVALDFPGLGGSERPNEVWDVGRYAGFVEEFLKKVGIFEIYAVVGHSFGGRVMMKRQFGAKKLVFMDAAGVRPKRKLKDWAWLGMVKVGKALGLKKILGGRFGSEDYKATSGVMREIFKKVVNEDLSAEITDIKQESLVIWGESDEETPISDVKLFEKMKNVRIEILSGAGHYVFLDRPREVLDLVRGFLK